MLDLGVAYLCCSILVPFFLISMILPLFIAHVWITNKIWTLVTALISDVRFRSWNFEFYYWIDLGFLWRLLFNLGIFGDLPLHRRQWMENWGEIYHWIWGFLKPPVNEILVFLSRHRWNLGEFFWSQQWMEGFFFSSCQWMEFESFLRLDLNRLTFNSVNLGYDKRSVKI